MTPADLLEIPEVRAQVSPISVEHYHTFPELNENGRKTELIDGVIIEKMPKSPLHGSIAKLIYDTFRAAAPTGFDVRPDQPLTLRRSEPEPDVAIVRGSSDDFWESHPTTAALVVEVALTSLGLDRKKAAVYAEAGVEEYWIVIARERKVEVYTGPSGGTYGEVKITEAGTLNCGSVPGIALSVPSLFGPKR